MSSCMEFMSLAFPVSCITTDYGLANLRSIGLTLLPLPMSLLKTPQAWSSGIHGNVWTTVLLFVVR